jgi:hypothetical protein
LENNTMKCLDFAYASPEPLAIDFAPPLKVGDGLLDRIVVREPKAGEVFFAERHFAARQAAGAPRKFERSIISKLSGVPEEALADLPLGVFTRLINYVNGFIDGGFEIEPVDDAEAEINSTDGGSMLTISFDPPLSIKDAEYPTLNVSEPTLGQMAKAEISLGDGNRQRVRLFQMALVTAASSLGQGAGTAVIDHLPISVLNRAATFCVGFSKRAPAT